jgi:hypothetical protein
MDYKERVNKFLENFNLYELCFEKALDPYKKFDIAIKLKKLKEATQLASQLKNNEKWKVVADLASELGEFSISEQSMIHAKDYNGLLFYYSC